MTKVIAVASGKGGVGKTTTAINLGAALARFGRKVIVVDGNLANANVGLHLGAPIVPMSVHDALKGKEDIRNCIYMHPSGLRIAPGSISVNDLKGLKAENFGKLIKQLEGTSEIVIVDCAAGLGKELFSATDAADEVLVVTTADLPAVTGALKAIETIEDRGTTVSGVVLNRIRGDELEMSLAEIESVLERPVIAEVPEDEEIRKALKKNHPVVYSNPDARPSTAFKELAALMIGQKYEVLDKK